MKSQPTHRPLHPIQGILFDLGDTLLDFGKIDVNKQFRAGAELAYAYLKSLGYSLSGFNQFYFKQLWTIRWSFLKSQISRRDFNALELLKRLTEEKGHTLIPEQLDEFTWCWYEPLSHCARVEPGLAEMLARFRDQGLAMGIVSNTFLPAVVLDRHLAREGLLEFFPVRIYSCEFVCRKPDSRIFQHALARISKQAETTIYVGDSVGNDIKGSNRLGMISVLKDREGKHLHRNTGANYHIESITELADIVARHGVSSA